MRAPSVRPFVLECPIKLIPGLRIRTPSGRYARVLHVDSEQRVHVRYYDDEGGEGLFPAKLVDAMDVVTAPDPVVRSETHMGHPVPSEAPEYGFYIERAGRTLPRRPG